MVIAGGGPVGATLAVLLRRAQLRVALVEPSSKPVSAFRPIALSHGSRLILERIGLFGAIAATPITAIHVSQAGGFGRTLIRREDHALPALGYVCDAGAVAAATLEAAAPERVMGRVASWRAESECVRVTIDAARAAHEVAARMLVLADGGQLTGDDLALRDYGQTAIVARVRTEIVRQGVAFERFTDEGPLALLPFAGSELALVWTVRSNRAATLAEANCEYFLAALGARFGRRLGRFVEAGPRSHHPLKLWFRRSNAVSPRVVAVGNAAQTLHPVAGQGLNLGLRDAAELADLALHTDRAALGGAPFLDAFESMRRYDRLGTIGTTDFLVRVFSNRSGGLRATRGAGLAAFDLVPPARRFLARRMMFGMRGFL